MPTIAQVNTKVHVDFFASPDQRYGFDKNKTKSFEEHYETLELSNSELYQVPHKSVGFNKTGVVRFVLQHKGDIDFNELKLTLNDKAFFVDTLLYENDTIQITLPKRKSDYSLNAYYKKQLIGKLNVNIYSRIKQNVIIVPLLDSKLNKDSLERHLNAIYIQAGIKLTIDIQPLFKSDETILDFLSNPSEANDRYTSQMTAIRDAYFEQNPSADKSSYYLFVVPGFVSAKINGYMVRNKAIGFIKESDKETMHATIARQLGYGMGSLKSHWKDGGPLKGSTFNLMDDYKGSLLNHMQWESIRSSSQSISYFDDYEDVQTNSGIIAYYFWKEDQQGNIIFTSTSLLGSINRPFKKNQYSVYLDIDNILYTSVFSVFGYLISVLHILTFLILLFLSIFFRRRIFKKWTNRWGKSRLIRFVVRIMNFGAFIILYILFFILINRGYPMFEVNEGLLKELNNMSLNEARKEVRDNNRSTKLQENDLGSEIVVRKGDNWYLKKRKRVLYFSLVKDGENGWKNCQYITDADTLAVDSKNYRERAQSHYMVFDYLNELGERIDQKVFNHLGVEITQKLNLADPAKRILIFVNGYRPTSMGQSFEENFADIQKNGLEFPNSSNKIYTFDRYDYWRPWKEIDLLFSARINPAETYYADGHFSVSTSNHRSLVDFTTLSTNYPKRCKNKKHHVCHTTEVSSWFTLGFKVNKKTSSLFKLKPNKKGFKERRTNGKVAGRNLNQIFNELPNRSSNDTLYIVAHSMGYAYALGIIDQLRGKINFGGLYIIAPENASAGKIEMKEWQEVWQFGDDFKSEKKESPCLLDGIAPQTKVGGLTPEHRIFIPKEKYSIKGFYDSHFIGYYTWIFKIDKNSNGYIKQR